MLEDGIVVLKPVKRFDAREFAQTVCDICCQVVSDDLLILFEAYDVEFDPYPAEMTSVSLLLERLRKQRRMRAAIITRDPAQTGKALAASIIDSVHGMETKVFPGREEAVAWLRGGTSPH